MSLIATYLGCYQDYEGWRLMSVGIADDSDMTTQVRRRKMSPKHRTGVVASVDSINFVNDDPGGYRTTAATVSYADKVYARGDSFFFGDILPLCIVCSCPQASFPA